MVALLTPSAPYRVDILPSAGARSRRQAGRRAVTRATYRRRRLVVLALVAAVLLATRALVVGGGGGPLAGASGAPPVLVASTVHVVGPGDTLWSIARALQPHGDVRPLVDELSRRRGGAPLRIGERIELREDGALRE